MTTIIDKPQRLMTAQEILETRIDEAQRKARTRLLSPYDTKAFLRLLDTAIELSSKGIPFESIECEVNGGGVANSYNHTAHTTSISLQGGQIHVCRGQARSGTNGNTLTSYLRVRSDGTGSGRQKLRDMGLTPRGGWWFVRGAAF